jgi:hypothetical protein
VVRILVRPPRAMGVSIMKRFVVMAIVGTAMFAPAPAGAGERVNDMALGAASGALVGGPVGLVAGGVIGYVAGPDIGRSFGFRRHRSERSTTVRGENRDTPHLHEVPPDSR